MNSNHCSNAVMKACRDRQRKVNRKDSSTQKYFLRKALIILFWIGVWQAGSMAVGQEILFAGPAAVVRSFRTILVTTEFWLSVGQSLFKISLGFLAGFLLGILFGGIAYRLPLLDELLSPVISLMKSIPIASFIVLVLVWLNSGSLSVFISFFVVFPAMYAGTLDGLRHTDRELLEMAFVFKIPALKCLRYIYLPESFPFLISSCKMSLGMCWKAGIAAEIIGTPKNSIGEQLYMAKIYLSTGNLFAWTLVIIILSVLFESFVLFLMKAVKNRLGAS